MKGLLARCKARCTPGAWAGLYALFLLTVFVLWVPQAGYANIVLPKHRLFIISTLVFLAGTLVLLRRDPPRLGSRDRLPFCLAGLLLLVFLLSALASAYPDIVWLGNRRHEGFVTLGLYLALFCAMALWGRLGKWHALGCALAVSLAGALALAQFLGYNPLGLYPDGLTFHDRGLRYSGEYLSTIGNSDLLSPYLTMSTLYLLGVYAIKPGREAPVYLLAGGFAWFTLLLSEVTAGPVAVLGCLVLCLPVCLAKGLALGRMGEIFAILALGAAGKSMLGYSYDGTTLALWPDFGLRTWCLLAAAAAGLGLVPFLRRIPNKKGFPKAALALVLALVLCILGILGFLYTYSGESETLSGLSQLLHGNPPLTLGSSRIAIWQEAWALCKEKPLLGGGPDTYQLRSQLIFTRELPSGQVRRTSVDAAHCEYLNLWVNTGLPSMLLFLALLGSVLLPALKRLDAKRLPLLLPALGYAIGALFGISQSLVSPLFYLYLGALARANRTAGQTEAPPESS